MIAFNKIKSWSFKFSTVSTSKTEIIKELRNVGTFIGSERKSKVYVDGSQVQNVESLIQTIEKEYAEQENIIEHQIQIEQVEKSKYNYNEFIFNENVPTLDFGEIFNRNFNVLNRLNVVSLDQNGKIYNAYLGTSYDEQNKGTLHIGSTNTNINVGTETLLDELEKTKFSTHDTVSIDFNNIVLNASKQIISKQSILFQPVVNGVTYNIMTIPLIGMCSAAYTSSLFTAEDMYVNSLKINEVNSISNYKLSLYNLFKTYFNINLPDNANMISLNLYNIHNVLFDERGRIIDNPQFNEKMYYMNTQYGTQNVNRTHILFTNDLIQGSHIINNNIVYPGLNLTVMYYTAFDEAHDSNKYFITLSIN